MFGREGFSSTLLAQQATAKEELEKRDLEFGDLIAKLVDDFVETTVNGYTKVSTKPTKTDPETTKVFKEEGNAKTLVATRILDTRGRTTSTLHIDNDYSVQHDVLGTWVVREGKAQSVAYLSDRALNALREQLPVPPKTQTATPARRS